MEGTSTREGDDLNATEREDVQALIAKLHGFLSPLSHVPWFTSLPIQIQVAELSMLLEHVRVLEKHWSAARAGLEDKKVRIKQLEEEAHVMLTRLLEAEDRATAAEYLVLPVPGGRPGEIDVFSDSHSHHFVPSFSFVEMEERATKAEARATKAEARVKELEHRASYRQQPEPWADEKDIWSEPISEAHPINSGSHGEYEIARLMVKHRYSKVALIDLVNWLLVRNKEGRAR